MPDTSRSTSSHPTPRARLSLDTWAVLLAFVLAALVRAGVLKTVPW